MYPTSGIALPTCHFGRYWWGPSYIEKIWKNRKRSLEIRATHQWSTVLYGEHLDKSSSIDPSVQAVRTFASTDSERGYPRVQWISGGGCVHFISFLTRHLILQLFEPDIFRFERPSVFFGFGIFPGGHALLTDSMCYNSVTGPKKTLKCIRTFSP